MLYKLIVSSSFNIALLSVILLLATLVSFITLRFRDLIMTPRVMITMSKPIIVI